MLKVVSQSLDLKMTFTRCLGSGLEPDGDGPADGGGRGQLGSGELQ